MLLQCPNNIHTTRTAHNNVKYTVRNKGSLYSNNGFIGRLCIRTLCVVLCKKNNLKMPF